MSSESTCRIDFWPLTVLAICFAANAHGQAQSPPFRESDGAVSAAAPSAWVTHATSLERRFFETPEWTFYHSLTELPADMAQALRRVAGADIVGPGESLDISDVSAQPGRVQHLYTAVAGDIGVSVWYSGGAEVSAHALLVDRKNGAGCHYAFGDSTGTIIPIRPMLRLWIQHRGLSQGGCQYVAASE